MSLRVGSALSIAAIQNMDNAFLLNTSFNKNYLFQNKPSFLIFFFKNINNNKWENLFFNLPYIKLAYYSFDIFIGIFYHHLNIQQGQERKMQSTLPFKMHLTSWNSLFLALVPC